jgi:tetratricopeptide (TPR) repeat protein
MHNMTAALACNRHLLTSPCPQATLAAMLRHRFQVALKVVCYALFATICVPSQAQDAKSFSPPVQSNPNFVEGNHAFDSALYDVAADHFAKLLSDPAVNLSQGDRQALSLLLVESHVRAGQPDAALDQLRRIQGASKIPDAIFWRAIALKSMGRAEEAIPLLRNLLDASENSIPYEDTCRISYAQALATADRWDEAIEVLEVAMEADNPSNAARARVALAEAFFRVGKRKEIKELYTKEIPQPHLAQMQFLRGQVALDENDAQLAHEIFDDVLSVGDNLPMEIMIASWIGLAISENGRGKDGEAARILIRLIDDSARSTQLLFEMFSALDSLRLHVRPDVKEKLNAWKIEKGQNEERSRLAGFFSIVADEQPDPDAAVTAYKKFIMENPGHPLVTRALLRVAVIHAEAWKIAGEPKKRDAIKALEQLKVHSTTGGAAGLSGFDKAKGHFAVGEAADETPEGVDFAVARFDEAIKEFLSTSHTIDASLSPIAYYNAAIAALRADSRADLTNFITNLTTSPDVELGQELTSSLLVERGLYLASKRQYRSARQALKTFLKMFPNDPRRFDAYLAQAEIATLDVEPRIRDATDALELAERLPSITEAQRQRLDYTRFWMEESKRAGASSRVKELGARFLAKWRVSPWRDAVRMKLGEIYFRNKTYLAAKTQFEALESENPDSPLAEPALFFAAKASLKLSDLEKAIEIWQRVYELGGTLCVPARYEQALAKSRQLKYADAAELLESLLNREKPPTGELRFSILCTLGETLFSQARDEPSQLDQAREVFGRIINDESAPVRWRNQALFRLAKCYQQEGDDWHAKENEKNADSAYTEAKKAYFKVLRSARSGSATNPSEPREYLWFYRAGFQLIEFLKSKQDWDAAISVADTLADTNGPRAQRAKEIATVLRGQSFLWKRK